ncbi:hypothetical protein SD70_21345 [Gordoniibacillus kamchatkensis]|uniref:Uncharacterized protein n=1 Tax=Gordoniibacillus kamchatkensis TaxID=1590651 RepID=A0ABR5ADU7_9BACL|nr:hypothetical protein [Paenibacillus sp. VKM B-2647]KIL39221.1 hypothetical protein SD70_21345 [Paenibacillus sp. VKM B-2647]
MTFAPWMYVVLLGLVCLVYAQMLPRPGKTAPSGDMMKELEQSMELFASDMEQQNESLLQLFTDTKRDYEAHLAKLSGRLEQLEKQNQQLVQELTRPKPDIPTRQETQREPIPSRPLSAAESAVPSAAAVDPGTSLHPQSFSASDETGQADGPLRREPLLMNVRHRYAELFKLHGQQKSVEYIAKKLGMNKGEVQLIIQLARQEDAAHV